MGLSTWLNSRHRNLPPEKEMLQNFVSSRSRHTFSKHAVGFLKRPINMRDIAQAKGYCVGINGCGSDWQLLGVALKKVDDVFDRKICTYNINTLKKNQRSILLVFFSITGLMAGIETTLRRTITANSEHGRVDITDSNFGRRHCGRQRIGEWRCGCD